MTEADYTLYREAQAATHRLPPKSARAFIEQLSNQNGHPDVLEAYIVNLVATSGEKERARALSEALLNRNRSAWSLAAFGYRCQETAEYDRGLSRTDEALIEDPENVMALDVACGIYCLIGDFDRATEYAQKVFDVDVDDPERYHLIPIVPIVARDFAAARKALLESPDEFVGTASYWSLRSVVSRSEERVEDAIAESTKDRSLTPIARSIGRGLEVY